MHCTVPLDRHISRISPQRHSDVATKVEISPSTATMTCTSASTPNSRQVGLSIAPNPSQLYKESKWEWEQHIAGGVGVRGHSLFSLDREKTQNPAPHP